MLFIDERSELLIPTPAPTGPSGYHVLEEDLQFEVATYQLEDGRKGTYAFTSEDQLLAWKPEGSNYIGLMVSDVIAVAREAGTDVIFVDPESASPWALVVERDGYSISPVRPRTQ